MVKQNIGITWDCTNGVIASSCTDEIIEAASDGLISPLIAETFLLDQVPDAHKLMESMAFTGKIVIRIS